MGHVLRGVAPEALFEGDSKIARRWRPSTACGCAGAATSTAAAGQSLRFGGGRQRITVRRAWADRGRTPPDHRGAERAFDIAREAWRG